MTEASNKMDYGNAWYWHFIFAFNISGQFPPAKKHPCASQIKLQGQLDRDISIVGYQSFKIGIC